MRAAVTVGAVVGVLAGCAAALGIEGVPDVRTADTSTDGAASSNDTGTTVEAGVDAATTPSTCPVPAVMPAIGQGDWGCEGDGDCQKTVRTLICCSNLTYDQGPVCPVVKSTSENSLPASSCTNGAVDGCPSGNVGSLQLCRSTSECATAHRCVGASIDLPPIVGSIGICVPNDRASDAG